MAVISEGKSSECDGMSSETETERVESGGGEGEGNESDGVENECGEKDRVEIDQPLREECGEIVIVDCGITARTAWTESVIVSLPRLPNSLPPAEAGSAQPFATQLE